MKIEPIKGKKTFELVYKKGRRFNTRNSYAFIIPRNELTIDDDTIYFTASISKKTAKKAVIRNRVRRLLKESFRQISRDNEQIDLTKFGYI